MSMKRFVGTLAVLSFWAVLLGHAYQVYLSWVLEASKFSLILMILLWGASMSFIGVGFAAAPRDYYMVSSRLPSVVLCLLSIVQTWNPRVGIVEISAAVAINAAIIFLMVDCSRKPGALAVLRSTSRAVFALAYTVGMLLQVAKLLAEGTHGASLFYWSALFGSSAIWIWHGALRKDQLLVWVFSAGTAVLGGIVVIVAIR